MPGHPQNGSPVTATNRLEPPRSVLRTGSTPPLAPWSHEFLVSESLVGEESVSESDRRNCRPGREAGEGTAAEEGEDLQEALVKL